jgi:exodeoxyribonuclease VII small subunit
MLNSKFPMSSKPKPPGAELNFEKAMDRLEAIVEQMESGKLPLEDLIVRYEEGMGLVKVCQERLASAEQKIEIIARNSGGKPVVQVFEPVAEANIDNQFAAANPSSGGPAEKGEKENDEVRLF